MLAGALLLVSCSKKSWEDKEVSFDLVRVAADKLTLRTDTVGSGKWARKTTFVLVDAHNSHDKVLRVDIGGKLVDAEGTEVAPLKADSLVIPPGGDRTFALVDSEGKARPRATSAKVQVIAARTVDYEPNIKVTDGHVYMDEGRVVATAYVHNTHPERGAKVVVIAGFYDAAGKPMKRPYDVIVVQPKTKRAVQFVGPAGSKKGYVFIGQTVFP
jgi:hypothetical protein